MRLTILHDTSQAFCYYSYRNEPRRLPNNLLENSHVIVYTYVTKSKAIPKQYYWLILSLRVHTIHNLIHSTYMYIPTSVDKACEQLYVKQSATHKISNWEKHNNSAQTSLIFKSWINYEYKLVYMRPNCRSPYSLPYISNLYI